MQPPQRAGSIGPGPTGKGKAQSYAGLQECTLALLQAGELVFIFLLYQYEPGQPPLLFGASLDPFRG